MGVKWQDLEDFSIVELEEGDKGEHEHHGTISFVETLDSEELLILVEDKNYRQHEVYAEDCVFGGER